MHSIYTNKRVYVDETCDPAAPWLRHGQAKYGDPLYIKRNDDSGGDLAVDDEARALDARRRAPVWERAGPCLMRHAPCPNDLI